MLLTTPLPFLLYWLLIHKMQRNRNCLHGEIVQFGQNINTYFNIKCMWNNHESWSRNNRCDVLCYCCPACAFSASLSIHVDIGYIPKYWMSPQKMLDMRSKLGLSMKACGVPDRKFVHGWQTDWHTALLSHPDRQADGEQIPPARLKTARKISQQRRNSQFSSAAGSDFHPTAVQQQTPAPSFLLPTSLSPHSFQLSLPSISPLLFRWLPLPPLVHSPKHTSSTHPPHRLPLSIAAAKNKTGWCGGPMGEAPHWWSSASPAWALTPLNSSTWFCLFNIQSAVGSGVSHSL